MLYLAFIPLFFLWVDVGVAFANPDEVTGAGSRASGSAVRSCS